MLILLLGPASALAADAGTAGKASFYFAAHEDDWQLFMKPTAFKAVIGGARKIVFVHLTAGDGGSAMLPGPITRYRL